MSPAPPPGRDLDIPERCRLVSGVLTRIGDKWSVLVIMMLGKGPRRFNELKRSVGSISQRMLTLTLRGLERDGLVVRVVTPSVPPRVDYALTTLGRSLRVPVEALGNWAIEHQDGVRQAQAAFDRRPRDGVVKDGVVKDGVVKDGVVKDGVAKDGAACIDRRPSLSTPASACPDELTAGQSTAPAAR